MVDILSPGARNDVFEYGVCVLVLVLVLVLVMVLVDTAGEDEADGGVGRWGDGGRKNESDQGW